MLSHSEEKKVIAQLMSTLFVSTTLQRKYAFTKALRESQICTILTRLGMTNIIHHICENVNVLQ